MQLPRGSSSLSTSICLFECVGALVELLCHFQELEPVALVLDDRRQPSKALCVIPHVLNLIGHAGCYKKTTPTPSKLYCAFI